MFGFLKKKLKEAVNKFTKKAEEEIKEEVVQEQAILEKAQQQEEELLEVAAEPIEDITKEVEDLVSENVKKQEISVIFDEQAIEESKIDDKKSDTITEQITKKKVSADKPVKKNTNKSSSDKEPVIEESRVIEEPSKAEEVVEKKTVVVDRQEKKISEEFIGETEKNLAGSIEKIDEVPQETVEQVEPEKKKNFFSRLFKKEQPSQEQQGVISRLKESFTKKTLSEEKFDELFWDLEVVMLENNVAVEVIEKIKADLKETLTSGKVSRMGIEDLIHLSLKKSIEEVLSIEGFDLLEQVKQKKPFVIAMIGVNGTGKTTTLAKLANLFKTEGLTVVVAASDTFRAAAIDQLKEHTDKLGVKLISQGYGADPAAVAFDAIEHAKARGVDVVMIDTAGRLHSNTNLMAELGKVIRVAKPDLKIFIGESITGNDCVEQAREFDKIAGIDAIILSKADVDEKGGAAISVSFVTKKPILYLGVGQAYGDLKKFDKHVLMRGMGL